MVAEDDDAGLPQRLLVPPPPYIMDNVMAREVIPIAVDYATDRYTDAAGGDLIVAGLDFHGVHVIVQFDADMEALVRVSTLPPARHR
jgi:hypothetical protein